METPMSPEGITTNAESPKTKDTTTVFEDLGLKEVNTPGQIIFQKEAVSVTVLNDNHFLINVDFDNTDFRNNHDFRLPDLRKRFKDWQKKVASRKEDEGKCIPESLAKNPLFRYPGNIQAVIETVNFIDGYFKPIKYEPQNPLIQNVQTRFQSSSKKP
jgi:hypothetical protein